MDLKMKIDIAFKISVVGLLSILAINQTNLLTDGGDVNIRGDVSCIVQ